MPQYKPVLIFAPFLVCLLLSQPYAHANSPAKTIIPTNPMSQDTLPGECPNNQEIEKIINEAIALGAPIYNEGLHIACYRIYEWAAYKILYEYGKKCPEVEKTLKAAIEKSHGDYSDTEKAWIMRMAFDKILGVPTKTGQSEKDPALQKG
jgi:hypothetical protein